MMPNNSPDQIRKKLYEEYEDSLLKLIMYDAAEKEGQLFLKEKEDLKNVPESQPSTEAFNRFSELLDCHLKKQKANTTKPRITNALNKVAVCFLLVVVLLFTTAASVKALRIKVLNFFVDIHTKYTSYQIKESNNGTSNRNQVVNWTNAYVPTYIPDGYKIGSISSNNLLKQIVFENQQDKNLRIFYIDLNEASSPAVDTENASVFKAININGYEGTLVVKNSIVTIVWSIEDHLFTVQAPTSEDTAIKIAEGVKYID